jgi:hypothetical protein
LFAFMTSMGVGSKKLYLKIQKTHINRTLLPACSPHKFL